MLTPISVKRFIEVWLIDGGPGKSANILVQWELKMAKTGAICWHHFWRHSVHSLYQNRCRHHPVAAVLRRTFFLYSSFTITHENMHIAIRDLVSKLKFK